VRLNLTKGFTGITASVHDTTVKLTVFGTDIKKAERFRQHLLPFVRIFKHSKGQDNFLKRQIKKYVIKHILSYPVSNDFP